MARWRRSRAAIALSLLAGGCEIASHDFRSERVVSDLEARDPARRRKAYALLLRHPVPSDRAGQVAVAARKAALDRSDPLRDVAFDLLAHMGRREGEAFASVLADPAEPIPIRMRAAEIVDPTRVTGEAALAAIVNDSGTPLPLRIHAARSLATGCLSAAAALGRAMKDGDPSVREVAARALAGLGDAAALKAALAPDGDPGRRAAIAAIGSVGPNPVWALPQLESALGDPLLRRAAFAAVADTGVAGVPVLVAALRVPDADTRLGAARALEHVRWAAKAAIGPLEEVAARDADETVRVAAASALREIGPSFLQLAAELDGAADESARRRVIAGIDLGLMHGAPADTAILEALRRRLRDPSPSVRSEAISALAYAGAAALVDVPEMIGLLAGDPAEEVRSRAALALLPLYFAAVEPDTRAHIAGALETARQDPAESVRRCADQSARGVRSGRQRPFQRCAAAR